MSEMMIQRYVLSFVNISRYTRNQWLRFHHIVVLAILYKIDGLDPCYGTYKVGFTTKIDNSYITVELL